MEENKNLVISYSCRCTKKYRPEFSDEENSISERIQEIMLNEPTDESVEKLRELMRQQLEFVEKRRVTVRKEYPEFLIKDFKAKEELFDFLDEDEPMILKERKIRFESVPDCLKEIGITCSDDTCSECVHYIERKHGYGED